MTTVSNVSTTEYAYTPVQGAQTSTAPNSIHTVAAPQTSGSVEETQTQNTSKLDELLEKLCAELSKFGLKPEELKKSGIIFRITGMNANQVEKLDDKELKNIIDCLKEAIKDSVVDGKVDLEKAGTVANDYYIALKTGWSSIESFKKNNKSGESLSDRMERFFGLEKGGFAKLPQAKIEKYLDRYFNQFFVEKLKNAKTQKEKENIYKQQLQDFGKLLINTPDSEKAIFKQAISSLVASNRIKGLDAVLASFDTPQARTEWADSWSVEEIKNITTKADVEGNIPEQKDATALVTKVTAQSSDEAIEKRHDEVQAEAIDFFKNNKEALETIAKKEVEGEELTAEEKALKLQRDNYFTSFKAGEITGTALNEIIAKEVKTELLDKMNKDAYELPIYKEVLKQVTEFIEKNPEALTIPKEELTKVLDEATNGNYSVVASGSEAELKAPAVKEEVEVQNADYGFTQRKTVNSTRLDELKKQLIATDVPASFRVEKPVVDANKETSDLEAKLEKMNNNGKLAYITQNFYIFSYGIKTKIGTSLKQLGHQRLMQILPQINNDSFILGIYQQVGLTSEDVEKLNVSISAKNIMLANIEKREDEQQLA